MKLFYDPRPFLAENKQRAIKELAEDTIPDRDFYLLVVGAVLLAISGIFLDSIPVLIASMVVAPLAYPILLLSFGLVARDSRLVKKSTAMLAASIALAAIVTIIASFLAIRVFGASPDKVMISFSPNYFFDIFIALVAGFIAAYGLMRVKVGAAMTGIGIAVSLMPPLVATGIEIAAFNISLAIGAFIIFILNVFGIILASYFAFAIFGFNREYKKMSILVIAALLIFQAPFVFAQMSDMTAPTTDTAPVEETMAPPADTTGPIFISIATASPQETEVSVVWTTDELAYGFVEYGETTSYGLKTSKSTTATMDNTVAVADLTPGTAYHFRIVAEDESGNISYSEDRTFDTAVGLVAMDNTPPEITEVSAANITASGATIGWTTNELAQGKIEYGKTAGYGTSSPLTDSYAAEHSVSLSGLDPDTEYHYRVVVQDESGNEAVSPDETFITDSVPAPAPTPVEEPVAPAFAISHVETASVGTSTAVIIWNTNEQATSQVFYGVSENYASSSAVLTTMATSHEVKLMDLKAGTNYFYKVVSQNASGATIEKSGFEFNTLFVEKTTAVAPTISNMEVQSIGTSTAVIVFNTDIPAAGEINYGTTTAYGKNDGGHAAFLTNHSHPLSELTSNTVYNFEAVVRDANGNQTIYENQTFTTQRIAGAIESAPADSEPEISFNDFETGGGARSYFRDNSMAKPIIIKTEPLNGQTLFVLKNLPKTGNNKFLITRDFGIFPIRPDSGRTVYYGYGGTFTDAHLQNGKTYYYSVFKVSRSKGYSKPIHISVAPRADKNQVKLNSVPPVVQKTPIYTFSKMLSLGDENKRVEHLQVLLASKITGYFGPLTENAVKTFQKRYKFPVTGVADMATLKKLEKLSGIEVVKDKAEVYDKALARDLTLGQKGGDVSVLQQFLTNAEVYPEALITGYFGPLTKLAVQRFQQEQNIVPASGYFGPITKKRLLNLIRLRSISF